MGSLIMSNEATNSGFPATRASLIEAMRSDDDESRQRAVEEVARVYWKPVYAWFRGKGHQHDEAAELTQGFFLTVVMQRNLLGREGIEPGEGRIRALIRKSLRHYRVDNHRREVVRGRGSTFRLPEIPDSWGSLRFDDDPDRVFDQQWAMATLDEAIQRSRSHFIERKPAHWRAFELRVLEPTTCETVPPPMEEIAAELGFATRQLAASAVQVVRKRVQMILHEVVAESCGTEADALDEIERALDVLGV